MLCPALPQLDLANFAARRWACPSGRLQGILAESVAEHMAAQAGEQGRLAARPRARRLHLQMLIQPTEVHNRHAFEPTEAREPQQAVRLAMEHDLASTSLLAVASWKAKWTSAARQSSMCWTQKNWTLRLGMVAKTKRRSFCTGVRQLKKSILETERTK